MNPDPLISFPNVLDLDIWQMLRLVERYAKTFPVLMYTGGVWPDVTYARYYGKWRETGYAIVFLPADPLIGLPLDHWAFMPVAPARPAHMDRPDLLDFYAARPVFFMGCLPCAPEMTLDHEGNAVPAVPLWWKGYPTDGCRLELQRAVQEGWGCVHCFQIICPCEVRFMRAHPDAVRVFVSAGGTLHMEGWNRAEVAHVFTHPVPLHLLSLDELEGGLRCGDEPIATAQMRHGVWAHFSRDYRLTPGPDFSLNIRNSRTGAQLTLLRHRAVEGFSRLLEKGFSTIAHLMPAWVGNHFRTAWTWAETFWPCFHWMVELPTRADERIRIAQFGVRLQHYVDRDWSLFKWELTKRLLNIACFAVALAWCASKIRAAWPAHVVEARACWCRKCPPRLNLLTPVEQFVKEGTISVAKTVFYLYSIATSANTANWMIRSIWRRRAYKFVEPVHTPVHADYFGDLRVGTELDIPNFEELVGKLRVRQMLDAATVRHTVSNHLRAMGAFDASVSDAALAAYVQRQLSRVGYMVSEESKVPPLPANDHCWVCRRKVKTRAHKCKDCRKKDSQAHLFEPRPPPFRTAGSGVVPGFAYARVFAPIHAMVTRHPKPDLKSRHYVIMGLGEHDLYSPEVEGHGGRLRSAMVPQLSWREDGQRRVVASGYWSTQEPEFSMDRFWQRVARSERPVSVRGVQSGPGFQGCVPGCFPRGEATAAVAFIIRNLADRAHWWDSPRRASRTFWSFAFDLLTHYRHLSTQEQRLSVRGEHPLLTAVEEHGVPELWKEGVRYWLDHLDGAKKREAEEAIRLIDEGEWPELEELKLGQHVVKSIVCKGFTKSEKTAMYEYNSDTGRFRNRVEDGDQMKPRFICAVGSLFQAALGPMTHAQTKWLSAIFSPDSRMFYAGSATPDQLAGWLKGCVSVYGRPFVVVDDISAMDANHNPDSFEFHRQVRHIQFPACARSSGIFGKLEELYDAIQYVTVKVGAYRGRVSHINPSGVPDTSYKNSLMAILIRWAAYAHATYDIFEWVEVPGHEEWAGQIKMAEFHPRGYRADPTGAVLRAIGKMVEALEDFHMAASGDDGLLYVSQDATTNCGPGREAVGTDIWMQRYKRVWNAAGFDIKVKTEKDFELGTFLAQQPVLSTAGWEWAPEPGRRLRHAFFQFESPIHPVAWLRGVARQLLVIAPHCPVMSILCPWILQTTKGPTALFTQAFNPHNPMWKNEARGTLCAEGVERFLRVRRIPREVYDDFAQFVRAQPHPFVMLEHTFLSMIFAAEC